MSKILVTAATAAILLGGTSAHAQDKKGYYVGAGAGMVVGGNTRANGIIRDPGSPFDGQRLGRQPDKTAKGRFDLSPTTNLTVGYDFGKGRFGRFRLEGELFYQQANTDKYKGQLNGTDIVPAGKVDTDLTGLAVNVTYDIGEFRGIRPFATLGFGRAKVTQNYSFPTRGRIEVDANSQVLQGGFGADYSYNEKTTFDLKYRFRRTGNNGQGLDVDIDAHILEFGIRYQL